MVETEILKPPLNRSEATSPENVYIPYILNLECTQTPSHAIHRTSKKAPPNYYVYG